MITHFSMRLMNLGILQVLLLGVISIFLTGEIRAQSNGDTQRVEYKVGFLGAPSHPEVEWNDANLKRMKDLGFNVLQLNIAWGYRPNDEALNLEDVIDLPSQLSRTAGGQESGENANA